MLFCAWSKLTLFLCGFTMNNYILLSFQLLLWLSISKSRCEFSDEFQSLLLSEQKLINNVKEYIEIETKMLSELKNLIDYFHAKNQHSLKVGYDLLAKPLDSFMFYKRLTTDWSRAMSLINSSYFLSQNLLNTISDEWKKGKASFPNEEDLKGAALSVLRLQDTYKLKTSDMASGNVDGFRQSFELTSENCFHIGRIAYELKDYYHCLTWMQEALDRFNKEIEPALKEREILPYLAFSMYKQGNLQHALYFTKRLKQLDPTDLDVDAKLQIYEKKLIKLGQKQSAILPLPSVINVPTTDNQNTEENIYESLCRGDIHKTEREKSQLFCYLKRNKPFLQLAPIKVELIHREPIIVLFRQALTDNEIEIIKSLVKPKLERSFLTPVNSKSIFSPSRVSKSGWLKSELNPVLSQIAKRQEDMTDLNMESAEKIHVATYGVGGYYRPHFDYFADRIDLKNTTQFNDDRIATLLTYLSAPEAGGATVFVNLNLTVFPSKNDAIFWHNLLKSGKPDNRTKHAGCPSLSGIKWISTRWFHETGQEFRRPCSLNINE